MKKDSKIVEFFVRGLFGVPIGISISFTITVIISIAIHDGNYYPVSPMLAQLYHGTLYATILQFAVSAFVGFIFGATTLVWEQDAWNLTMQTIVDFAIRFTTLSTAAWLCRWYPQNLSGIATWIITFSLIYLAIWIIKWLSYRNSIHAINIKLEEK